MLFESDHYWLRNANVPASLIMGGSKWTPRKPPVDNLLTVDIEIQDGLISTIMAAGTFTSLSAPSVDLQGGMVWACFAELHTHLDKGHTEGRSPNPDGSFAGALGAGSRDAKKYWNAEDVYRRMEFGLKCSYVHGTRAIRTHIDSAGKQGLVTWEVFDQLRLKWADRLHLQAVALVALDHYLTPSGEKLADLVAEKGGILGGVAFTNPDLEAQIDRSFVLAKSRKLALDFHVDENNEPDSKCLRLVAEAAIRHRYKGKVVCGHCCSLSVQPEEEVAETIALVKKAGIAVVSLPMCNLYLQDRSPSKTPYWRGVTQLHELKKAGVPVAISSDNCRDPFFGFGDHDGLEVFNQSVRIAHLDRPYGDWVNAITLTPGEVMGLPTVGQIGVGLPADLILFKGRSFGELLSRSQHDRIVLREGRPIDQTLPDYGELDDLMG